MTDNKKNDFDTIRRLCRKYCVAVPDKVREELAKEMVFYHGTSEENWRKIQAEGMLWGIGSSYRYTYLTPDLSVAEKFGDVILEVTYAPKTPPQDNYNFYPPEGTSCWQFSVFDPISLDKVRRRTMKKRKEIYVLNHCDGDLDFKCVRIVCPEDISVADLYKKYIETLRAALYYLEGNPGMGNKPHLGPAIIEVLKEDIKVIEKAYDRRGDLCDGEGYDRGDHFFSYGINEIEMEEIDGFIHYHNEDEEYY